MDYAKPFAKVGKATFTVTLKDTEYSKTFEVSVKAADKTALNNAIAAAEKLTEDKYESGWDAFQAAFDAAKKVAAGAGGQAEPERQGGCHRDERPEQDGCLDDGVRRGRGPAAGRRCRRGAAASPRRVRREPPSQDSGMSGWPPLRNRWRPSFPAGMS